MSRIVLNVAEKPTIAKSLSEFLSEGPVRKELSKSKYNPIYSFNRQFQGKEALLKITSVTGHIEEIYFGREVQNLGTM